MRKYRDPDTTTRRKVTFQENGWDRVYLREELLCVAFESMDDTLRCRSESVRGNKRDTVSDVRQTWNQCK